MNLSRVRMVEEQKLSFSLKFKDTKEGDGKKDRERTGERAQGVLIETTAQLSIHSQKQHWACSLVGQSFCEGTLYPKARNPGLGALQLFLALSEMFPYQESCSFQGSQPTAQKGEYRRDCVYVFSLF